MEIFSDLLTTLLMNPKLSRALPKVIKGEPMPRSLNCTRGPIGTHQRLLGISNVVMENVQMQAQTSGNSDNRSIRRITMDHQLSSQGLSANSLKIMWGVTLLQS